MPNNEWLKYTKTKGKKEKKMYYVYKDTKEVFIDCFTIKFINERYYKLSPKTSKTMGKYICNIGSKYSY